ncbi:hypothetical protein UT300003_35750 [Clostridium sardiniense]
MKVLFNFEILFNLIKKIEKALAFSRINAIINSVEKCSLKIAYEYKLLIQQAKK